MPRRRLVAALGEEAAPLVLVSAPSGAGKTLAVCQWLEADERQAVWVHLDRGDNDPITLLQYAARALGHVTPLDPVVRSWLSLPQPPVEQAILPTLVAAASGGPPFVLVFDDVHLVRERCCWELLRPILDGLAPGSTAVLCGRSDPPLALARWLAAGRLAKFRFEQLAFDRSEVEEMLRLHGLAADAALVDRLLETTEGWAAGLYFATLALKQGGDLDLRPAAAGEEREIADYLATEVLADQPPELVEFLTRTSIVDRVSPDLGTAVTGRGDSLDALRQAEHENLFIVALDGRRGWYRYHHLFAELLQTELRRREPQLVPELHRRAARWYEEQDWVLEAVRHWVAAGDVQRAGDFVAARWVSRYVTGRLLTARLWLDEFQAEQLLTYPPLAIAAAWLRALTGDSDEARGLLAGLVLEDLDAPSPDGAASLRSSVAMLNALLGSGGPTGTREHAAAAVSLEHARGDGPLYGFACQLLGAAEAVRGNIEDAVELLHCAAGREDAIGSGVGLGALGHLSLLAGDAGDWKEARRLAREATARAPKAATTAGAGVYLPSVPARVARDRLRARHGEDDALVDLEQLFERLDAGFCPWLGIQVALVLAETHTARDDALLAHQWLAEARDRASQWGDAPGFARRITELETLLRRRLLVQPVSAAEMRVLELLPTHLSVRQMAAQLSLSPNTVSSHIRALYRKLGVNCRGEAVERATTLGLLTERPERPSD